MLMNQLNETFHYPAWDERLEKTTLPGCYYYFIKTPQKKLETLLGHKREKIKLCTHFQLHQETNYN